jgi:hypothetical protein
MWRGARRWGHDNEMARPGGGRLRALDAALAVVMLAAAISACTAAGRGNKTTPASGQSGPRLGAAGCHPPSPIRANEVEGTPGPGGIQLRGLLDAPQTGMETKIVWRVTGSGRLDLTATGPDGRERPLAWGPQRHISSDFNRPGDEWGAGYLFDKPGCWELRATRADGSASVWIQVAG